MSSSRLTIGAVARHTGVNIETVRYYERRGLVAQPPKPANGFRIYPDDVLQRIRFIRRAQKLGFTLREIQKLLSLGDSNCKAVQEIASDKLRDVQNKIRDLNQLQTVLTKLLHECEQQENGLTCPIVESLDKVSHR